jgi:hypothetical protein
MIFNTLTAEFPHRQFRGTYRPVGTVLPFRRDVSSSLDTGRHAAQEEKIVGDAATMSFL